MAVFMIVSGVYCAWFSFARSIRNRSLVIRIIETTILVMLFILFVFTPIYLVARNITTDDLFDDNDPKNWDLMAKISKAKSEREDAERD